MIKSKVVEEDGKPTVLLATLPQIEFAKHLEDVYKAASAEGHAACATKIRHAINALNCDICEEVVTVKVVETETEIPPPPSE